MLILIKIILIYLSFWAINFIDLLLTIIFSLAWFLLIAALYKDPEKRPRKCNLPILVRLFTSSNLWLIVINIILIAQVILLVSGYSLDTKRLIDLLILLAFALFYSIGCGIVHLKKSSGTEPRTLDEPDLTFKKVFRNLLTPFANYKEFYKDWIYETRNNEVE